MLLDSLLYELIAQPVESWNTRGAAAFPKKFFILTGLFQISML
jgi:hypothetical protein